MCRGGFPSAATEKDKTLSLNYAKDYVETLLSTDIIDVDGIKRNSQAASAILKSYARNISSHASMQTILLDIKSNFDIDDIKNSKFIY